MPLAHWSCTGSSRAATCTDAIAVPPGSYSSLSISSHCLRLFFPITEEVCKPFGFEQCQLNIEADFLHIDAVFLHIDAVFLSLLVVPGSSQANCLRAYFIAACDSKERKCANTLPTREEKCQVRLWERQRLPRGSSRARRSSSAQARRAGHQLCQVACRARKGPGLLSFSREA